MRKDNAGRERSASIGLVMLIKEEVVYCHARARREGCDRNDQLMDLYPSVFWSDCRVGSRLRHR